MGSIYAAAVHSSAQSLTVILNPRELDLSDRKDIPHAVVVYNGWLRDYTRADLESGRIQCTTDKTEPPYGMLKSTNAGRRVVIIGGG
jgi:hypothetical protein